MKLSYFLVSLLFALASGVYWSLIGQFVPIAVPMMLNNSDLLMRVLIELGLALVMYVGLAMLYFRWLLSHPRS
jgi:hypothetical protein